MNLGDMLLFAAICMTGFFKLAAHRFKTSASKIAYAVITILLLLSGLVLVFLQQNGIIGI